VRDNKGNLSCFGGVFMFMKNPKRKFLFSFLFFFSVLGSRSRRVETGTGQKKKQTNKLVPMTNKLLVK
jgi:hypothetical protein